MSPADVLVAATVNGAAAIGMPDRFGVVARGKQADLLAVRGDPTEDIAAVHRVSLVMQAGKVVREERV